MNKLTKCKQYIANKTNCNESELNLKIVYQDHEVTQFKLINAYDLVCKYNINFAEFYNF